MSTGAVVDIERFLTICNACRYCEGYCPVFPALERRSTVDGAAVAYLANLCHNCGECLYACQYAPPHEFGLSLPRALAEARAASYCEYAWPRVLAGALRKWRTSTSLVLCAAMSGFLGILVARLGGRPSNAEPNDSYAVIPHAIMVYGFGAVGLFVLVALSVGGRRCCLDIRGRCQRWPFAAVTAGLRDALSAHYLHGSGSDCSSREEVRTPARRWFHQLTFGGFALCFASTCTAAAYDNILGWRAPYPLSSVPVKAVSD